MHIPLRCARVFLFRKRIRILLPERLLDIFLAINLHRTLFCIIERTYVVKSSRMVLVVVRQQYGINMRHILPKHLLPEVRARVYEYPKSPVINECARTQPLVALVAACAHLTAAAYHRDALRCACPEKCKPRPFCHIVTSVIFPISSGSYGLDTLM